MNILTKTTPLTIAIKMIGKTNAMQLSSYISKGDDNAYEIVGMAVANFDETLKYLKTTSGSIDIYNAPCYSAQIQSSCINEEFVPVVEEGIHTCSKCGGKKTVQHTAQMRSGDEGSTTTVFCIGCKNRWVENN
jgi:DNA-directed RNA polymerase subunit M/transcription elongation factor TFIIS